MSRLIVHIEDVVTGAWPAAGLPFVVPGVLVWSVVGGLRCQLVRLDHAIWHELAGRGVARAWSKCTVVPLERDRSRPGRTVGAVARNPPDRPSDALAWPDRYERRRETPVNDVVNQHTSRRTAAPRWATPERLRPSKGTSPEWQQLVEPASPGWGGRRTIELNSRMRRLTYSDWAPTSHAGAS